MYRLYDSRLSGNAWKLRVLMRELGIPFERVTLDLAAGDARKPEFARISRFQRVPVLELPNGAHLVESAAIMLYLAEGSPLLPSDSVERAEATSWLFFEQADLVRPLGLPRFFHLRGIQTEKASEIEQLQQVGYAALEKLERRLKQREWLANDRFSVADLGVFPYVAISPVGGYDLTRFEGVQAWLKRIEQCSGWEPLVPAAV